MPPIQQSISPSIATEVTDEQTLPVTVETSLERIIVEPVMVTALFAKVTKINGEIATREVLPTVAVNVADLDPGVQAAISALAASLKPVYPAPQTELVPNDKGI